VYSKHRSQSVEQSGENIISHAQAMIWV